MPVIRIDIGKESVDSQRKEQLIEKLTKVPAEVTNVPPGAYSVIISEHNDENYGGGGGHPR